jgi:hypothetical protein
MISASEGRNINEFPNYYTILHENFIKKKHLSNVNFFYNSKNNKKFLSVKDLKLILKKYSNQT